MNIQVEAVLPSSLEERCGALVEALSLAPGDAVTSVVPLTGGVASDIAMVELGARRICAKFALGKLKVREDWRAPVHRNRAEYAWLQVAADLVPEGAVKLYGRSTELNGFAMEFLDGASVYLWKSALLAGEVPAGAAARVGDLIGRIHKHSARSAFDRRAFDNRDDFRALRIEPYLTFTAGRRRDVARELTELAELLYAADQVLVHGDVSPKNIFFRGETPIVLDAECATMGDASFDPAFCLNHLVLKAIHLPATRNALFGEIESFWQGYGRHLDFVPPAELEARVCRLLPALMLARVEGKSPVEYLDQPERETVCRVAIALLKQPSASLSELVGRIARALEESAT